MIWVIFLHILLKIYQMLLIRSAEIPVPGVQATTALMITGIEITFKYLLKIGQLFVIKNYEAEQVNCVVGMIPYNSLYFHASYCRPLLHLSSFSCVCA